MTRIDRVVAMGSPPIAALIVLVAGAVTPGYDPSSLTVSRLAMRGLPAAAAVDLATLLAALSCFALAAVLAPNARACRAALAVSGMALMITAIVHLDPASTGATAVHRIASGNAVLGLIAAPFLQSGRYRRISLAVGVVEVAMLLSAPILIATSFNAWGAWERGLLALALFWMAWTAATTGSTDEIARASAASLRSSGS